MHCLWYGEKVQVFFCRAKKPIYKKKAVKFPAPPRKKKMQLRSVLWLKTVTHSPNDSAELPHKLHSGVYIQENMLYSRCRLPASRSEDARRQKQKSPPSQLVTPSCIQPVSATVSEQRSSTGELILLRRTKILLLMLRILQGSSQFLGAFLLDPGQHARKSECRWTSLIWIFFWQLASDQRRLYICVTHFHIFTVFINSMLCNAIKHIYRPPEYNTFHLPRSH